MIDFETILRLTQKKLFVRLMKEYTKVAAARKGSYLLVKGEAPVLLLAHLDTVHKEPVRDLCKSEDGNIWMSPQGIGGDDRCGVNVLVSAYAGSAGSLKKPWLLFTCDEEIGGVGAERFANDFEKGILPKELTQMKMLIEIDRKGKDDAVFYDCANKEFEQYVVSKGFKTQFGSFSDISIVAPALGVAAVNLSSGYYNAHTPHEYINIMQMYKTLGKVRGMIADAMKDTTPQYKYIEAPRKTVISLHGGGWPVKGWASSPQYDKDHSVSMPPDLKGIYADAYDELLYLYEPEELEFYRQTEGDEVLLDLYELEFGPKYGADNLGYLR